MSHAHKYGVVISRPRRGTSPRRLARSAAALALASASTAGAATQYWDPNGATSFGGNGTWDTSASNPVWTGPGVTTATDTLVPWMNGNAAVFTGTGNTVTIASAVDATGVTMNASSYNITGGTLMLNGGTPIINFGVAGTATTDTISATIAGTSSLTGVTFTGVTGSTSNGSSIAVTGANNYAGTTSLLSSIVQFNTVAITGTASSFGASGNVLIGANGSTIQLVYTGSGGTTDRLFQFDGADNNQLLLSSGAGAVNFFGTGPAVGGTAGARTITFGGTYTGSANTFGEAIGDSGGSTSIIKSSGNVAWTLSGANTYTGSTTYTSGTLNGIGAHAFGSTSVITIGGSSILGLLGDASTVFDRASPDATPYPVTTSGSGATINVGNATAAGTAAKTMTIGTLGTSSTAGTFYYNFSSGTAGDSSSLSIGAVTGPATTAAGTVNLYNGISAATGSLTLASYNSSNTVGGETLIFGSGGNTTVTGAIAPSATTGLAVSKPGGGTVTLLGSSTYAGGTLLTDGILSVGQGSSLGTGTLTVTPGGTTSGYTQINALAGLTLPNPIATTVSGSSAFFRSVAPVGATFNVAGPINGSGGVQAQTASQISVGPIEFSSDTSSYTGTFNTGGGIIAFTSVANGGSPSSLGAGSGPYTLANVTNGLTLQYLGANSTATNRALSWTGTTGTLNLDASGAGAVQFLSTAALRSGTGGVTTLTFQGSNTGGNTLAQAVNDDAGATTVAKIGVGTWVLTGLNSYTGGTNISGGTLVANTVGTGNSATGTAAVNVLSGGTLAGGTAAAPGMVGGTITIVSGGRITAGSGASASDSVGALNTGVQSWNASGSYVAKVAAVGATANTNDELVMTGLTVNASSGAQFNVLVNNVAGGSLAYTTPIVLAEVKGTANPFTATALASLKLIVTGIDAPSGYGYQLDSQSDTANGGGFDLIVDVTAAPEPTSLLLLAAAAGPMVLGRRRRKQALNATK